MFFEGEEAFGGLGVKFVSPGEAEEVKADAFGGKGEACGFELVAPWADRGKEAGEVG